jgi:hypothetical protein
LPVRGNQTNNFFESVPGIILAGLKKYNVVTLSHRLTVDLENNFKENLLSIVDGRFEGHYRSRFMGETKAQG